MNFAVSFSDQSAICGPIDTLIEARGLVALSRQGKTMSELACCALTPEAFGIAMAIVGAASRNHRTTPDDPDVYFRALAADRRWFRRDGFKATLTRHSALACFRKRALLPEKVTARHVCVHGSIPSVAHVIDHCVSLRFSGKHEKSKRLEASYRNNVLSGSRATDILKTRFQIVWILRNVCGHTPSAIGRHLNRDHTSILNALQRIEERFGDRHYQATTLRAADFLDREALADFMTKQQHCTKSRPGELRLVSGATEPASQSQS